MNDKEKIPVTATQKEILTAEEAAELLQVHIKTLYKLAEARKIPGKKLGGVWRFSRTRLHEFLGVPKAERPT